MNRSSLPTSFLRSFRAFCVFAVILLSGPLSAEPRFRADDGNAWHLTDNPALPASQEGFSLGAAISPMDSWNEGVREVEVSSPLLSLSYRDSPQGSTVRYGASLGLWDGAAVGYRADASRSTTHNFGLLWRPFDLLSSAVTLDNAVGARVWGAGFALRPLTLAEPRADWLTLTSDFGWGAAREQRWGAKIAWGGTDVRGWYDVESRSSGFEVTVSWGPSETSAKSGRLGQAFKFSPSTPEVSPVVLRLRIPHLAAAPLPSTPFFSDTLSLPALIDLLDRAAGLPQVVAVAFEDPPSPGLGGSDELRAAIKRLRAAGKRVYIHADNYEDSIAFQGWIASADRVSIDPNGVLILTAGGSKRLYLKEFFDKIGVRFINLAPWDTKSAANPLTFASMPEGEKAMLARYLADRDQMAANALAAGRGGRLTKSVETVVAEGPYLSPREALAAGLVDELENRSAFEDFLRQSHRGAAVVDTLPEPVRPWGPHVTRSVAVVHLTGDILPGRGQAGAYIGSDAAETIAKLRKDFTVKAILLRVDSPGGVVQPSDAIAEEVRKTVAAGKPVVVSMGNVAASGGYYLSAPATRIFAQPGTLTGSIGVTAALFTAPKALEMLGIKADGIELAPSAAFFDWTKTPTDAMLKKWGSMINETYQRFLDVVVEGRQIPKDKLEPLARGQIYTGHEALALGLVDELGGEYEAKRWLEKTLGGKAEFFDVVPGDSSVLGRLIAPLATAAVNASNSSSLKLAQTLDQYTAPWADAITGLAARGGGPLVWVDEP